jgi:hypothetical protein
MSVVEIIEQIKALPREEQRRVFDFVDARRRELSAPVRFASDDQVKAAGEAVVAQSPEVFRRLAE